MTISYEVTSLIEFLFLFYGMGDILHLAYHSLATTDRFSDKQSQDKRKLASSSYSYNGCY